MLPKQDALEWLAGLTDEEAVTVAEEHNIVGAARHQGRVRLLRFRKAMRIAGNTKAVAQADHLLKWIEDNKY